MNYRTDLVIENERQINEDLSGIQSNTKDFDGAILNTIKITNRSAAKQLSRPLGSYYTVEFPKLESVCDFSGIKGACIFALESLFKGKALNKIMVVGLGNIDITPDALGPKTATKILATRHLSNELKKALNLSDLKSVSVLIPGVLGKTGIEAHDTVKSAVKFVSPDAIILIDALAAVEPSHLCTTLQLTDAGINPGSGVQNARKGFSFTDFKIPVIAIGMPTVIDASSYSNKTDHHNMMVTPKDIDMLIDKASTLLSEILNEFLQPSIDSEVIKCLT